MKSSVLLSLRLDLALVLANRRQVELRVASMRGNKGHIRQSMRDREPRPTVNA
jgi:hypothetical protein